MNRVVPLALALILALSVTGCAAKDDPSPSAEKTNDAAANKPAEFTVQPLDGWPEDVVPLYKSELLDTAYYSVRNDPQYAAVEGGLRNIHHVVYHTAAPTSEVLEYYLGLMTESTDADASDDYIEGTIGTYPVQVNTTEESSYNAVYITVDLPKSEVTDVNPFYAEYPAELVEAPQEFVFFEDKYYEYLYRSTDMAYWRQFDIADRDGKDGPDLSLEDIYAYYRERYGSKTDFAVDQDARTITWMDGKYNVTLAFYEAGNRGVLQLGWDWEQ
ncbi:MAG: hypothetical protein CVT59_01560 [Actinobacteria bacterium HGW-Actinobacteria-1]|nr:MAG: hypothetical protein CVT59_01560 [Actinobacteria bacterium HGW-Actinobacteria-1]